MKAAAKTASDAGKPWVLDPVAVGATSYRRQTGAELLALRPGIVRGNASEILALAAEGGAGKGVDSGDTVQTAEAAARAIAGETGGVVAVTGPEDFVTDGARVARVDNGHALMPKVTALGCALTGVVAAFASTAEDPFEATVAALAFYGLAGEKAAARAEGPGSFAVAFLDALATVDGATLDAGARIA